MALIALASTDTPDGVSRWSRPGHEGARPSHPSPLRSHARSIRNPLAFQVRTPLNLPSSVCRTPVMGRHPKPVTELTGLTTVTARQMNPHSCRTCATPRTENVCQGTKSFGLPHSLAASPSSASGSLSHLRRVRRVPQGQKRLALGLAKKKDTTLGVASLVSHGGSADCPPISQTTCHGGI